MRSHRAHAVSKLFSTAKSNASTLALALALLTLLVTATAVGIALAQFRDAQRALALSATASAVSLHSAPKSRYFDVLLENAHLLLDDDTQSSGSGSDPTFIRWLVALNLRDYLHGIEIACGIYFDGFLDEDQKRFIADYVKADIDLLLYGYDEDTGWVGFFGENLVNVPWMTPDLESVDEYQGYEATRKCLTEWHIKLEKKTIDL